jgi:hypothetical protein
MQPQMAAARALRLGPFCRLSARCLAGPQAEQSPQIPNADAAIDVLAADLAGAAVVDTVALSLHSGWLDDLAGDATALARGIALTGDDDRFAAPILAADLAAATVVIAPPRPGRASDLVERALPAENALLSILAPDAIRLYPATPFDVTTTQIVRTGRFRPEMLDPLASRALLDPSHTLPAVCEPGGHRQRGDRPDAVQPAGESPRRRSGARPHLAAGAATAPGALPGR